MSSNFVEKIHENVLKRLMEKSGLECVRSRQLSQESEVFEGNVEEQAVVENQPAVPEELLEEEVEFEAEEQSIEEEPAIFPTLSLRRLLPDKIRRIEAQNRAHVLPEVFKKDLDPAKIPKIVLTPHQKYIDILAEMVGCVNYKSSLAEFWFLDTLANLLRRAQEDDLNRPTQALLILWFCEWMKEMEQFDAADRPRMMRRFEENMLAAARHVATERYIPTPDEAGVVYKSLEEMTISTVASKAPFYERASEPAVTFEGMAFECAMRDLTKIIHYIFDLFCTDYQYDLVRSVFTFTPDYVRIDSPYQLQVPKRLYTVLKAKAKKEPKKEAKKEGKGKKTKQEPDTAEYIALMELKAKEGRELEEREEKDREDYNFRSQILPLAFAATQDLFDKYWPPPTPEPEPEPEPAPTPKGKGKKK